MENFRIVNKTLEEELIPQLKNKVIDFSQKYRNANICEVVREMLNFLDDKEYDLEDEHLRETEYLKPYRDPDD